MTHLATERALSRWSADLLGKVHAMRTNSLPGITPSRAMLVLVSVFGLLSSTAAAQIHHVDLVAAELTKTVTLPSGHTVAVPMWGFALVGGTPSVPGPRIVVPRGTSTLEISLTNSLSGPGAEPVSLVIPGQAFNATPVRNADGRIVSMTPDAAPGGAAVLYTFNNLKPGTFLYQSGSHQALQVQMGLYGAVTMEAGPAAPPPPAPEAYAGVPYDSEVLLLYSEIDVALHQAVAAGSYGTAPGPTSTVDYAPSLFLVNGESYTVASLPIPAGAAGGLTLVRMLNAGLKSHVVVVDNASLALVAEDGNPYSDARAQASILLPAGKTHDAIWTPTAAGSYPVYDRMLHLVAREQTAGGMLAMLCVGACGAGGGAPEPVPPLAPPPPAAPVASNQELGLSVGETKPITLRAIDPDGDPLTFQVTAAPTPGLGTLSVTPGTDIPGGTLTYTASGTAGQDSFMFTAFDGTFSATATVTITVHLAEVPAAPVGAPLTLNVVGSDGAAVTAYYWTLEEDLTFENQPGVLDPNSLSVSFHRSYMPVVGAGNESAPPSVDPTKRYFVSVLPKGGDYTNSGAAIAAGQTSVTVVVNKTPLPTGQLRVQVFLDNGSLNGVLNNVEPGLEGFAVMLEDTAGTAQFAHQAAHQITDFNGNPLGTTYKSCPTAPAVPCADYEVAQFGKGYLLTDKDGFATFKNLSPGLYEVFVTPPADQNFVQGIVTIEGGLPIEAWVKPNEPPYFHEFGPPGPHVTMGFVQKTVNTAFLCTSTNNTDPNAPNFCFNSGPVATITGQITSLHMSRVPAFPFFSGAPLDFTQPIVALQAGAGEYGQVVYLQETDPDGNFTIANVPSGTYKLVVFDSAGAFIMGRQVVKVDASLGTDVSLGEVPVFQWHARQYHYVFDDLNQNGFKDAGERGIPEQGINLRFRDGSIYQSFPTDVNGFVPFEQIFPFFNWLIAEVDYTRFKATGVTVVVDDGGKVADDGSPPPPANANWPELVGADVDSRVLNPQMQSESGLPYRTETGPVLLEAWQTFLGQTNVMLWGKAAYAEPVPDPVTGIVPVDVNVAPFEDVDVAPFGDFPGPGDTVGFTPGVGGDVDHNGNGTFDVDEYTGGVAGIVAYSSTRAENLARWGTAEDWEPGVAGVRVQLWDATRSKLLNEATTDSYDESQPTGCQWPAGPLPFNGPFTYLGVEKDCFDGMRSWNQVRPSVFDGGWAFYTKKFTLVEGVETFGPIEGRTHEKPLEPGKYVVKLIVPPGYQIVKEEDKNVDFGNEYIPQQFVLNGYPLGDGGPPDPAARPRQDNDNLATPFCVGALHEVPPDLSLFPGIPGTYAGDQIPLCDEKLVTLRYGQNAAQPYFFLFTEAPVAGHVIGIVLDDTANEFDPNAPQFGEKFAPPWLPVSIKDYTGREIVRTYSDRNGAYNALVPSTFDARIPAPSGYSPTMLQVCVNPSLMPGPGGTQVPDPWHNKSYSQWCFPFSYMPGKTTYMDTPVVPTGAFAGQPGLTTVDAELPDKTPVVSSVNGPLDIGPYVVGAGTITLTSAGMVEVPNPEFDWVTASIPKHITRDYGFGADTGQVLVGTGIDTVALTILSWGPTEITAEVPVGTPTGQLRVIRCLLAPCTAAANQRESVLGVMLTVATPAFHALRPPLTVSAGGSIQAVIDAAAPGDLILVEPGTYRELVVMHKPVRLQGWGAGSTLIDAVKAPTEKLELWRQKVRPMLEANQPVPIEIIRCLPDGIPNPDLGCPDGAPNPAFDITFNIDTAGQSVGSYMLAHQADEYTSMVQGQNAPEREDGDPGPNEIPKLGDTIGDLPIELLAVLLGGEGAGVTVLGQYFPVEVAGTPVACPVDARADGGYGRQAESGNLRPNARVDGFSISGSDGASGIEVNGNACDIELSNNHLHNNNGYDGAGIKVGHVGVLASWADDPANNDRVAIRYNLISQNGSTLAFPGKDYSGGGGITIGGGAHGYKVTGNYVAGNFTGGYGAGIAHIGLSNNGTIDHNTVAFNESFNQMVTRSGGGIYVGGRPAAVGETFPASVGDPLSQFCFPPNLPGPTPGSGHVTISNNLIQGNQAASGDGGGISLANVNGRDINPAAFPLEESPPCGRPGGATAVGDALKVFVWDAVNNIIDEGDAPWEVNVFGNFIVNNVAGLAGGGVSLQDAAYVSMVHNTIAHNDSLSVAGEAFQGTSYSGPDPFISTANPAGIASYPHSPAVAAQEALLGRDSFSNPQIVNSIVWENRSFFFGPVAACDPNDPSRDCAVVPQQDPSTPGYALQDAPALPGTTPCGVGTTRCWDLGVLGGGGSLAPTFSVLTGGTAPAFASAPPYFNTNRRHAFAFSEILTATQPAQILAPPAFDEGGNFIRPLFGPLTLTNPATGLPFGDYHLTAGVAGQWLSGDDGLYEDLSDVPLSLAVDRDGDPRLPRPIVTPHRGADQVPPPGAPSITINDATVTEGDAGLIALDFTVSLSRVMATTVTVNFATQSGSARQGVDFVRAAGTLSFAPGTTELTVRVMVIGDLIREADERFHVKLRVPRKHGKRDSGSRDQVTAKIVGGRGVGVIVNDDLGRRARR